MHQLTEAAPMVRVPVADPSLRGLSQMIAFVLAGVREHEITLDDATRPFTTAAATVEDVLAGRAGHVFLARTRQRQAVEPGDLRRFIEISTDARFHAHWSPDGRDRRHPQCGRRTRPCDALPGPGAADRAGSDRERGIRHRQGRRGHQRHGHLGGRACSSCGWRCDRSASSWRW